MDDFVNILHRDYGLKPQGKSAPMSMSSVKSTIPQSSSTSPSPLFSSSSSGNKNQNNNETASFGPILGGIFEGEDFLFGPSTTTKNGMGSASLNSDMFRTAPAFDKTSGMSSIYDYDDVFGVKLSTSQTYQKPKQSTSHHNDDIFEMHSNYRHEPLQASSSQTLSSSSKKTMDSSTKVSSSLPIFDAPLYDDDENDIFGGLPGIKSRSVVYDDVFGGGDGIPSSSGKDSSSVLEDILGVPKPTGPKVKPSNTESVGEPSTPAVDFDDLLPGFGGTEPARTWKPDNGEHDSQKSRKDIPRKPANDSFNMAEEDPFIVFQTTVPTTTGTVGDSHVWDSLQSANIGARDRANDGNVSASRNSLQHDIGNQSPYRRKVHEPSSKQEAEQRGDDSTQHKNVHQSKSLPNDDVTSSSSPMTHDESLSKGNKPVFDGAGVSPQRSKAGGRRKVEVWVSVEDVKLVTQPTKAPPPSRRPPPLPGTRQSSMVANQVNGGLKEAEGKHKSDALADPDLMERSAAASASARAMEEAMERARSKLHDRSKEEKGEDTRASKMRNDKDKASEIMNDDGRAYGDVDTQANEGEERRAKETEKEERDKWRKEKEKEKEREREREKEREREREKDRIAVERATQEARERAATEARQRAAVERATAEARERAAAEARERAAAERAAVERANAEARERAAAEAREKAAVERATAEARERAAIEAREKAAVERATAEARERAAAEARERAAAERAAVEKATAEARERAAAEARERAAAERAAVEARERAAAERAAVERATSEARARAERAAVERATKEARDRAAERAALDARERAEKAAAEKNAATREQRSENDLEAFFSSNVRAGSATKQRSPPKSNNFPSNEGSYQKSSEANVNKVTPTSFADDWAALFGAASNAGEFQEVEGETAERRRARLERHQRTAERAAKALDEKNKRDLQVQREQAERHRASDILDSEIRRWAAGKEGNLRALLSTLQYVLWPECGWQPVSLTDLITGAAVKKVYRKATLCVHPDKVQQKGATIQQKYIAEKVFDLLKEAWNKFNSEELF